MRREETGIERVRQIGKRKRNRRSKIKMGEDEEYSIEEKEV